MKSFLEGLGFACKGEVGGCDLVALSGDDPPVVVIGELKLSFNLELVLQAVNRAAATHYTAGSTVGFRSHDNAREAVIRRGPEQGRADWNTDQG